MRRPCTSSGSSRSSAGSLTGHGWEAALTAAIAVLIITCPCALALAVPAVQVAATSRLFGKGVLVKAADGLERLAEIDTVVFDKTGTLTLGEPALADRRHRSATTSSPARQPSPPAAGIPTPAPSCARPRPPDSTSRPPADVREVPGFGLERDRPDGVERLGSAAWCGAEAPHGDTATVWYRAGRRQPDRPSPSRTGCGPMRPTSSRACTRPASARELLSGDRTPVVEAAAREPGIDRWTAGVLPAAEDRPPRGARRPQAARC